VEAALQADVANVLRGVYGVLRLREGSVRMSRICLDDYIPLLQMRGVSDSITSRSWVRIKRHRRYKQDLAFVADIDETTLEATVYVVPRLLYRKRRRTERERPPPSLFNPEAIRELHGEGAIRRLNQVWVFKDDVYKDGLVELCVHLVDLTDKRVSPTAQELQLFRCSQNQRVVQAVDTFMTTLNLRIDDKIQVVAGQHRGLFGCVTDIHEDNTVTIVIDDADISQPLDLGRWEICKTFNKGDFIRILAGVYEGREGFIVGLDTNQKTATVYSRRSVRQDSLSQCQVPGEEVIRASV
jgi:ribosomal protein L24